MSIDDTTLGVEYVYCASHRVAHRTGWCTVSNRQKTPLASTNFTDACNEAESMGFVIGE